MKVYINEIFTSIEGEGIYLGTKTLFIRFAGCPLRCYWCDTPYALLIKDGKEYKLEEALKVIDANIKRNTYKVNLTGGDPLLQHKAVYEIAKHLKDKGLLTYLESSCYNSERFSYLLPYIDICKIEFKLKDANATSNYESLLEEELRCLTEAIDNKKVTYIKIVVSNKSNIEEVKKLADEIFKRVKGEDIDGFVIQPAYGYEPRMGQLLKIYDKVYEYYRGVRIIPQIQKVMNIP
ncbi:MAG: radical SAM protein [Candidatus Nitrosocaldaceae archaeon]|nr:MAG: radical SAM protein [Candidatus Nitrosocaldaceae archaeon]